MQRSAGYSQCNSKLIHFQKFSALRLYTVINTENDIRSKFALFRLPPRIKYLCSSGILCSVDWQLVTNVLE